MATKAIKFTYNNAAVNWMRKFAWNHLWGGREYGLLFHDTYFEPAPEVTEALRRLNLKEPHLFDQRKMRLSHAHTLATHGERLPKEQWTKWEEETWYLKPYLDEIENEKKARAETTGLIPPYEMKQHEGH
ncbi:Ubiquinol-cytochrome C reductase complex subunit [Oesophagostomum dentatum]|uniref:Cytochrome b-c1 complex subunit 7 n=1 Tax=Oesophagostomum dentatum TaxID=61180 RepID=A0A0B1SB97_OESDE|nr:Ubiquinol-cytochrome C reductase complex subunit [Oesophagostomum dentatum]KHJ96508.1 Ubiquinol-cytochrome C reductase complex subunit [Oesophagostomum dentatum]